MLLGKCLGGSNDQITPHLNDLHASIEDNKHREIDNTTMDMDPIDI
jgi:hypothetical protein